MRNLWRVCFAEHVKVTRRWSAFDPFCILSIECPTAATAGVVGLFRHCDLHASTIETSA
jgi:hypothetical protein